MQNDQMPHRNEQESEKLPAEVSHGEGEPSIAEMAIQARRQSQTGAVDYFSDLNKEQRQAVQTIDGPLLVLAGAGTGKTRVLTTRIAHILATRAAFPGQILAVTFTNKAAKEMKDRIASLVGEEIEGMPWLGTFHSICTKILRYNAELAGLEKNFTIIDSDDQLKLIKQVLQANDLDLKRWTPKNFRFLLDYWKNRGLFPKDISESASTHFGNGLEGKLYEEYQSRLKTLNAVDFGDLLMHTIKLFKENSDVLKNFQNRFQFMLVDEYQDTNVAQYLWLRLLTQGNKNICCVGDEDQSIFGWRGAEVDNILRFEKDFPDATVVKLERNYRSTGHILAAASHLISHNTERLGKTLYTNADDQDTEKVFVANAWDSQSEARDIGDVIESLQLENHSLNEMAILVRATSQMREFEERFLTLGLNYRVIGGQRFFDRKEIRDALAYFRVIEQPADDIAFERIVNTPKRGLGTTTINRLHEFARKFSLPLTEATRQIIETEELRPKPRNALKNLLIDFDRWRSLQQEMTHYDLAEQVLDESGYTEMWKNDRSVDASGRLENLKELIFSMKEFDSMRGLLEHVTLVMELENKDSSEAVNLMTMHASKGLEFDTVFLPGWEEGLFPNQRAMDENGLRGLEEERRLAYVAMTRAKKRLKIWFCSNRQIYGHWQSTISSRFLEELPKANLEVGEGGTDFGGYAVSRFDKCETFKSTYETPGWQRAKRSSESNSELKENFHNHPQRSPKTFEGELISQTAVSEGKTYSVGDRVFHEKFGTGTVTAVDDKKLQVNFNHAGPKHLIADYVRPV